MKITIDRIENGIIIAELPDGHTIDVPESLFPDAAEGDIYMIEKSDTDTKIRRRSIEEKINKLFED